MDRIHDYEILAWWLGILSAFTFVATLVAIPIIVIRMPAEYFSERRPPPDSFRGRHPAIRISALIFKNLLGVFFILAGMTMLLAPGQGVLSIIIGLTLVDFPGKRKLELRMIRKERVLRALNWMRAKGRRPPLEVDPLQIEEPVNEDESA